MSNGATIILIKMVDARCCCKIPKIRSINLPQIDQTNRSDICWRGWPHIRRANVKSRTPPPSIIICQSGTLMVISVAFDPSDRRIWLRAKHVHRRGEAVKGMVKLSKHGRADQIN
jgi:hypothetical protein